jgi:hypothetical protein
MLVINQVFFLAALQGGTKLKGKFSPDNVPVMVGLGDILPAFGIFN